MPVGAASRSARSSAPQRSSLLCRLGGGAGGEGYSVREACLLARSRLAQQRVLALRLLAAVLARSRPSADASTQCFVPLPANLAAELSGTAEAACVQWGAVWHHALHAADVTVLLRRSLDDPHPAVAAAAAEALAALVGAAGPAGAAEEEAAEAADSAPLTGWPAPPLRHMQARRCCMGCGWGLAASLLSALPAAAHSSLTRRLLAAAFCAAAFRGLRLGGSPRLPWPGGCGGRGGRRGGRAAAGQSRPADR